RRDHDDLRERLIAAAVLRVDERDPARLAAGAIDQDLARDGIRAKGQVAGIHRWINETGRRVEHGVDVAPAGAPGARPAAETAAPVFVVLQAFGCDAGTVRRQDASHLLE